MKARQFILLITLWTGVFCNYVCYSIIAPFFPEKATEKGLSAEMYSIVFGCYSLAQISFSLIIGRYLIQIGVKVVVIIGLALTGISTILFGWIEHVETTDGFFYASIAIRVAEGAGFAGYFTSVLAIVVETFPHDPGYYVGFTETIVTVGMIMGPPMGSFLYTAGGYGLPFFVFGGIICATGLIALCTVRTEVRKSEIISAREYLKVLKLPAAWLTIMAVCLNVVADAFILITLATHLEQFKLHKITVGFIYLCLFLAYGISSPVAGRLSDRYGKEFLLQALGSLVLTASFGLITAFGNAIWPIIIALLLKGLGAGPLICCSYSACLKAAKFRANMPNDFSTYTLVSTIVSFSIPLGNLIGGFSAGIMYAHLGMATSCFIFAIIFTILAFLCFSQHFVEDAFERRLAEMRRCKLAGARYNNGTTTTASIVASPERVYPTLEDRHDRTADDEKMPLLKEETHRDSYESLPTA